MKTTSEFNVCMICKHMKKGIWKAWKNVAMPKGILHRCLHYVELCFCTWWVPFIYPFVYAYLCYWHECKESGSTRNVVMDLKSWKEKNLKVVDIIFIFKILTIIKFVLLIGIRHFFTINNHQFAHIIRNSTSIFI